LVTSADSAFVGGFAGSFVCWSSGAVFGVSVNWLVEWEGVLGGREAAVDLVVDLVDGVDSVFLFGVWACNAVYKSFSTAPSCCILSQITLTV